MKSRGHPYIFNLNLGYCVERSSSEKSCDKQLQKQIKHALFRKTIYNQLIKGLCYAKSFIHYKDLYSTSSRLLLRSAHLLCHV